MIDLKYSNNFPLKIIVVKLKKIILIKKLFKLTKNNIMLLKMINLKIAQLLNQLLKINQNLITVLMIRILKINKPIKTKNKIIKFMKIKKKPVNHNLFHLW